MVNSIVASSDYVFIIHIFAIVLCTSVLPLNKNAMGYKVLMIAHILLNR